MKLPYRHIVAILYGVALFLDRLDLTIVNVALPTMATYFKVPVLVTDWVSIAFLLALAVSIPISSWLGDQFGLKKVFISALLLFGLGSTSCAFVTHLDLLIALRFVQGLGGGVIIPVGMTMLYRVYDKKDYASITSFTFIPSLIAPAIAPLLGGLLLTLLSWRFIFLFSGPVCILLAIYACIALTEDQYRKPRSLDWIGFLLSAIFLVDVFYTLSLLSREGFSLIAGFSIVFAMLLGTAFIQWEKRVTHPLIDIGFFKDRLFIQANLIQLSFQMCHFGAIFLVGIYLQNGVGMSAVMAGSIMGMQAIGAMVTMPYSVRLYKQFGIKMPLIIGLIGVAVLSPCILFIHSPTQFFFGLGLFFLRGIFSGLCGVPIQTLSVIDFEKEAMGQVNSIFNACRQVAISLGVAVSSLLVALAGNYTLGFFALFFIALAGVAITQTIKQPK